MENTETLIVEQLKAGNENAYRYLYDHHYALLCHVANGYLKDQFLSETIVGDTIFHLWEIRETLDISVSIRSYLLRAVRNRCINYLINCRMNAVGFLPKVVLKENHTKKFPVNLEYLSIQLNII